jgi:hypothetical protein
LIGEKSQSAILESVSIFLYQAIESGEYTWYAWHVYPHVFSNGNAHILWDLRAGFKEIVSIGCGRESRKKQRKGCTVPSAVKTGVQVTDVTRTL